MNCGVGTGVEVAGENGKGLVVVFRERYEAEEVSPLYLLATKILFLPARDFTVTMVVTFFQSLDADV